MGSTRSEGWVTHTHSLSRTKNISPTMSVAVVVVTAVAVVVDKAVVGSDVTLATECLLARDFGRGLTEELVTSAKVAHARRAPYPLTLCCHHL